MIAITVLFAPTSLVITTDTPPDLTNLVERDSEGRMTRINLPDRLVVMANHQAYTDWMYLWILACYSGNSRGVVILLKAALKNIPIVGWGMVCVPIFISSLPDHITNHAARNFTCPHSSSFSRRNPIFVFGGIEADIPGRGSSSSSFSIDHGRPTGPT